MYLGSNTEQLEDEIYKKKGKKKNNKKTMNYNIY